MKRFATAILLIVLVLFTGQNLRAAEIKAVLTLSASLESRFLKVLDDNSEGMPEYIAVDKQQYLTVKAPGGRNPTATRFIYFDIHDDFVKALGGKCYVVVEYLDNSYGWINLEYDSGKGAYRPAVAAGNLMLSTGKDRQALYVLPEARFKGRQKSNTDFRLCIQGDVLLKSISVSSIENDPAQYVPAIIPKIEPSLGIGKGFEVCLGGYDISKPEDTPGVVAALARQLPIWRQLGVTSHESYVRWNLIEREKGRYDFSAYDPIVELYRKYGMKWVPFIIIGPAYSLPDWYYKSNERVDYVCLEDNKPSDVQSIWNPNLPKYVEAFLKAFAQHYERSGVIESVLLGITGNYGESIYVATSNQDWTNQTHGEYHTHSGFWCGDEYARKDYREWLKKRFVNDIQKLNQRWGTAFTKFDEINPDKDAKGNQWLDFVEWYRGAMTDWAEFWVKSARKYFPREDIYLVTGGHMPPEHGLDISAQAKMCAQYKTGIRITNEASDYAFNFTLTRLVASSCKFYGTYFGFEPAGMVDVNGISGRNYNAAASGARHVHYYAGLVTDTVERVGAWARSAKFLERMEPIVDCAVIYPFTSQTVADAGFPSQQAAAFRDVTDFDWVDERMVRDGALNKHRVAVILEGTVFPDDVLAKMLDWVKNGGTLVVAETRPVTTLEGGDDLQKRIASLREGEPVNVANSLVCSKIGKGRAVVYTGGESVSASLAKLLYGQYKVEGFEPLRTIETDIGVTDRVYITYFKNLALVLNFNSVAVEKTFQVGDNTIKLKIEPYSIAEVPLNQPQKPKSGA